LLVSGLQLGWLSVSEGEQVSLILLAFVVPLQLITAVFGYLARDVIAGTGMGILAGTWLQSPSSCTSRQRERPATRWVCSFCSRRPRC
jgi:hypothetical protein